VFSDMEALNDAARTALKLMRDSGFAISGSLEVSVDPKLPFMGYSTQRKGANVIVVSGMALKSGLVEGLLIHEMCHIYRTEQRHPSHNTQLLNSVGIHVIHENDLTRDYQVKIIQQAVNHVQDIYADDIAFKVFKKGSVLQPEQAFEFFLDWINPNPIEPDTDEAKWQNIGIMLNNCFALSNLTRHEVPDINDQAKKRVEKFLSQANNAVRNEFDYFKDFMTSLKENVTEEEFEKQLTEYLTRIVSLAK